MRNHNVVRFQFQIFSRVSAELSSELLENGEVCDFLDSLVSAGSPISDVKVSRSKTSAVLRGTWEGLQKCLTQLQKLDGKSEESSAVAARAELQYEGPRISSFPSSKTTSANSTAETEVSGRAQLKDRDLPVEINHSVKVAVDPQIMDWLSANKKDEMQSFVASHTLTQLYWTPQADFVEIHGAQKETVSEVERIFKRFYNAAQHELKQLAMDEKERSPANAAAMADVDYLPPSSEELKTKLTYTSPEGITLIVRHSDITDEQVGAIVNPSNENLEHMSGVAADIAAKAGEELLQDSQNQVNICGELEVGSAVPTRPGNLPCDHVIHTVGPRWTRSSGKRELQLLKYACINSLRLAMQMEVKSIAIPAISAGVFGMPTDLCAQALFDSFEEFSRRNKSSCVREVRFVNIDKPTVDVFCQEFQKRFSLSFKPSRTSSHTQQRRKHPAGLYGLEDEMNDTAAAMQPLPRAFVKETDTEVMEAAYRASQGRGRGRKHQRDQQQRSQLFQHGVGRQQQERTANLHMLVQPTGSHHQGQRHTAGDDEISRQIEAEAVPDDKNEQCSICLGPIQEPKTLPKCKHTFCTLCLEQAFQVKPLCPICQMPYGTVKGNQPKGRMDVKRQGFSLPGHDGNGTVVITYSFRQGVQTKEHPNPGSPYYGTSRTAYLPDTREGNEVLRLLQQAFDAGLVFTIGQSATTGSENQVTWNDIHHKTSIGGGSSQYGYPDPTYLTRVKNELAAKGIK